MRWWLHVLVFHAVPALAVDAPPPMSATVGVTFDNLPARIGLAEARFSPTPRTVVAAGIAYFETEPDYEELQLRVMAVGTFTTKKWALENRHMFSMSTESVERYRVRLRLARSGLFGQARLSFRTFDEMFFDFDQGRFFRNNVALGFGVQLCDHCTAEVYRVWVDERSGLRGGEDYTLAMFTVRIGLRRTT
jgi:hypothetical protein